MKKKKKRKMKYDEEKKKDYLCSSVQLNWILFKKPNIRLIHLWKIPPICAWQRIGRLILYIFFCIYSFFSWTKTSKARWDWIGIGLVSVFNLICLKCRSDALLISMWSTSNTKFHFNFKKVLNFLKFFFCLNKKNPAATGFASLFWEVQKLKNKNNLKQTTS